MSNSYTRTSRSDGQLVSGFSVILSAASYNAQLTGVPKIALGVIREQMDGIPTLKSSIEAYVEHIRALNAHIEPLEILTPISEMSKAEVVALGAKLGVPFEDTWSCLAGELTHCGECPHCLERSEAFKIAGVDDPTVYTADSQQNNQTQ